MQSAIKGKAKAFNPGKRDKIDNAEEVLNNILDYFQSVITYINTAQESDSEVTSGGNSYNACEAGGFFKGTMREMLGYLPDSITFDFEDSK